MSKKGEPISKDEFEKYKNRFDKHNPGATKAVTFDRATFERILKDKSVQNIAIYYGQAEDGTNTLMLVGTDESDKILYTTAENRGQPCPPYCAS